jgi:hypothetical protein
MYRQANTISIMKVKGWMERIAFQRAVLMNLVVFGITWATGLEIVRHVLERGHSVTAMVRSPAPEHNPPSV